MERPYKCIHIYIPPMDEPPRGVYVVILVVLHRCGHRDVNHFNES